MSEEQKIEFKTIYKNLSQDQRDHLMSSFDKMESCFIEYETGKFIGCHLGAVEYEILGQNEFWSFGLLRA